MRKQRLLIMAIVFIGSVQTSWLHSSQSRNTKSNRTMNFVRDHAARKKQRLYDCFVSEPKRLSSISEDEELSLPSNEELSMLFVVPELHRRHKMRPPTPQAQSQSHHRGSYDEYDEDNLFECFMPEEIGEESKDEK